MKDEINAIPFTRDLWNTGYFTAVYRNGKPATIIRIDASGDFPVVSHNGVEKINHFYNGSHSWAEYYDVMLNEKYQISEFDLFLLPLPKPL